MNLQKIRVQWKHMKLSTCYKALGQLTLKIKISNEEFKGKTDSEHLVIRSRFNGNIFLQGKHSGYSIYSSNWWNPYLFTAGIKGRYTFIHKGKKKTCFHCLYLIVWPTEKIWSRLHTTAQYEINHLGITITKFPKGNWNNCSKTSALSGLSYSGNKFGCKTFDCKAKAWETCWVALCSLFSFRKCKTYLTSLFPLEWGSSVYCCLTLWMLTMVCE